MSHTEVEQAALQLPVKARATLAQKLLESLEQPTPPCAITTFKVVGVSLGQIAVQFLE
jgi:hypothetical protein